MQEQGKLKSQKGGRNSRQS